MGESSKLAALAPRLAGQWRSRFGEQSGVVLTGTVAKVDLSGFTRLSERLAMGVRGGAEELSDAIDQMFLHLIGPVLDRGGDVLQFGGDALVLWFEGDEHQARAAATCWEQQRVIREHGRIETPLGPVRLRMSAGMASGEVGFGVIGATHRELITVGPVVTQALHLEHLAASGQVFLSPATAAVLPASTVVEVPGAFRLRRSPPSSSLAPRRSTQATDAAAAAEFVPAEMHSTASDMAEVTEPSGEHRTVAVGFMLLEDTDVAFASGGIDAVLASAAQVAEAIDHAVRDLQVFWSATDLAENGIVFLLFTGAPLARDEDDERLLRSVRSVLDATADLPVRAGANRGRVFTGLIGHPLRRTHAFLGDTVNLAARLMGSAKPGTAVVSRTILEHSRAEFTAQALPPFSVKGKRLPIHAAVLGELQRVGRAEVGANPALVVGRRVELDQLRDVWSATIGGDGGSVEVVGEAGLGKSTIVAELVEHATTGDETARPVLMTMQCDPYESSSPYWSVRPPLAELAGNPDAETFVGWLRELDPALEPLAALAAPCFGVQMPTDDARDALDPVAMLDRRHDAVVAILSVAIPDPLLLVVEDLHWVDAAGHSLLRRIALASTTLPWLVVATSRPGGEVLGGSATRIELGPLNDEALVELASSWSNDTDLLDRDIKRLAERSGGNPLFFAQLLAAGTGPDLPDTVEQLLATRIDALRSDDRSLLRDIAVLGADINLAFAAAVLQRTDVETPSLWVSLEPFIVFGDRRMRFRHDLVRSVAYEGHSKRRRRALHSAAADLLAGSADDSMVAFHLLRAERWADAWPAAARAARSARQQGALADAAELAGQAADAARRVHPRPTAVLFELDAELADALELLGRLPDAEVVLRRLARVEGLSAGDRARRARQTARVQRRVGRFHAALAWVTRGLQALESMNDSRERDFIEADLLLLRSSIRRLQGHPLLAKPWAEAGLAIAERLGAPTLQGTAHIHLEAIAQELRLPAREHHEQEALRLLGEAGADGLLATVLLNSAFARHETGQWAEALELLDRAANAFERVGQGVDEVLSRSTAGMIMVLQGRHSDARAALSRADRISRAIGWRQGRAYAGYGLAHLDALSGAAEDAIARFKEAERVFEEEEVDAFVYEVRRWRAEALLRTLDAAGALAMVDALLADDERPDDPPLELAALRLRGHALAISGHPAEGRAVIELALARARAIGYSYEIALSLWAQEALVAAAGGRPPTAWARERSEIFAALGVSPGLTLAPVTPASHQ